MPTDVRTREDEHVVVAGRDPATGERPLLVTERGQLVTAGRTVATPWVSVAGLTPALYASGDAIGVPFTVIVPESGILSTVLLLDLDVQSAALDLWLFDSQPTATADNAAWDMADVDGPKSCGVLEFAATDYNGSADSSLGTLRNQGLLYVAPAGVLWVQVVSRGTPTYVMATPPGPLSLRFVIAAD